MTDDQKEELKKVNQGHWKEWTELTVLKKILFELRKISDMLAKEKADK